jgi:stress-induced morphogen
MPISREELSDILSKNFPDAEIEITALTNDDDHWQAKIISASFAGKTRVNQHRMVTDVLRDKNIHALSLITQVK